ncbi:MAG: glycyl-radical enzyme activating protein [Oscillospiraceae bacterium]|jgi:pyruvate formate lyase activating enzyme
MTGTVFNIQRFSTHDGPGIRTTVFLKGCPLRCFWCQNPESQSREPVLMFNKKLCRGCGRCRQGKTCPTGARTVAGQEMEAREILQVVLRDRAMYKNSGGGLTLSGGELTMQPGFSLELLRLAKEEGLHTVIETCGFCKWEILKSLLEYTDLVYYDIKCLDPEKHRQGTGVDNALILENAKKAAETANLVVRIPLIPGYNDSNEEVAALARYARDVLNLAGDQVELLKYNNLGESKLEHLGRGNELKALNPQTDERFEELKQLALSEPIKLS